MLFFFRSKVGRYGVWPKPINQTEQTYVRTLSSTCWERSDHKPVSKYHRLISGELLCWERVLSRFVGLSVYL